MIDKAHRYLIRGLEVVLITLMVIIVIVVCWQVFSRFILEFPSSYTDELSRFLLIWITMLGASYASGRNSHLAIDILQGKLKGKSRGKLQILIQLFILIFSISVLVVGGSYLVWITFSLRQISAALGLPMGWVYISIPVSGILVSFFSLNSIRGLISKPSKPH